MSMCRSGTSLRMGWLVPWSPIGPIRMSQRINFSLTALILDNPLRSRQDHFCVPFPTSQAMRRITPVGTSIEDFGGRD